MANDATIKVLSMYIAWQSLSAVTDFSVVLEQNAVHFAWIVKQHLESSENGFVYEVHQSQ